MLNHRSVFGMGVLAFSLILLGCGNQGSNTASAPETPASRESLQKEITRLKVRLLRLGAKVSSLTDGTAYVSTEEKGYAIAQTTYGTFSVVCENLTPYLDGYKAQLAIGNLTSATFNGAKITLKWGEDLSKSKEISVTNTFHPGRYTNVEVSLTPARLEDVKGFSVTLIFNQIALYGQ